MPVKRQSRKKRSTRSTASRSASARRESSRKSSAKGRGRKWSSAVTRNSDALDLENRVFKGSARTIAQSLKRSAERSRRRKSSPYRSAMSMLTFYINRAGKNLSASRRRTLESAKSELRKAFGKTGS